MELIIIAAIIAFLAWRMVSAKGIKQISTEQLRAMQGKQSFTLLDVRTAGEFKARHIQGAVNLPLGSNLSTVPVDKEVVVICQSGIRSLAACKQLKKLGYRSIANVRGGMNAWREQGR